MKNTQRKKLDAHEKRTEKTRCTREGFTLEQISDFINVAIENKSKNILAALMDYKNAHFSDFDPMESFLLD